jgi:transposase
VDRWHVGFVDLVSGHGLLRQVEGRTSSAVTDWINQCDEDWRRVSGLWRSTCCTIFKSAIRDASPG